MENPDDLLKEGEDISAGVKAIMMLQEAYLDARHLISELERRDVPVDMLPLAQLEKMEQLFETMSPGKGRQIIDHLRARHLTEKAPDYVLAHAQFLQDFHKATLAEKGTMKPERTRKKFEKRFNPRIEALKKMYPPMPEEFQVIVPYRVIGASTAQSYIIHNN